MVLPLLKDELELILEEKIKNDKVEVEADKDLASMMRSDTVTMTIEAMNDNTAAMTRLSKLSIREYQCFPLRTQMWPNRTFC